MPSADRHWRGYQSGRGRPPSRPHPGPRDPGQACCASHPSTPMASRPWSSTMSATRSSCQVARLHGSGKRQRGRECDGRDSAGARGRGSWPTAPMIPTWPGWSTVSRPSLGSSHLVREKLAARRPRVVALVRGCGQADALQTVAPVTYRCGTRRVCQARSSGSERDTRARPHAVAPMNCVPEDSRRRSTCTGRTHSPRARADGNQTPSSTVAVRAPSPF